MSSSLLLHLAPIVLAQTTQFMAMTCSRSCDEVFPMLHVLTYSPALHVQLDATGHPIPCCLFLLFP